jgi:FKBP-type peptidyl-prolyl cis-trans isomerase
MNRHLRNGSLIAALSVAIVGCMPPNASTSAKKPESVEDRAAYAIGFMSGKSIAMQAPSLNVDQFAAGVRDAFGKKDGKITEEEMKTALMAFEEKMRSEAMAKMEKDSSAAKAQGTTFLAENGKKSGVTTTASGLQYEVLKQGTGAKPAATDTVKVHYEGKLLDGTVFDSSVQRGEPVSFPLNRVIPGWTEGVQLMTVGSKYKFVIPSELAYGDQGAGPIPPHSVLQFEVELLSIEK